MRKLILALTFIVALVAGADAHAAIAAERPNGPSIRDRVETPIVRVIQKIKRYLGTITNGLPTDPIP